MANPYEKELVNFFQFWFTANGTSSANVVVSFEIDKIRSSLFQLPFYTGVASYNNLKFSLRQFMGREEVAYKPLDQQRGVFVFVLQGAFEVQYKLMETRDALALWNAKEIEIEALSNEAIIMLIEMDLKNN